MEGHHAMRAWISGMPCDAGCNEVPDQNEARLQNEARPQNEVRAPKRGPGPKTRSGPQNEVRAQEPQLAAEGRGLLPASAEIPATLQGTPPEHPFVSDPSGGFSRTIFETDEDPNFKLVIREFSFPPDRQTHTVTLPTGGLLHILAGQGEINIAKKPLALTATVRTAVPAGAALDVMNNSEQPVVVRALIVEAK
jgi:quercetin dioxygenase-like cupin family protein